MVWYNVTQKYERSGIDEYAKSKFREQGGVDKTNYHIRAKFLRGENRCPAFDKFLFQVSNGNLALISRIWEFLGYALTPDTAAKMLFLLQGVPNSGKSVLTELLSKLFSEDTVVTLDVHSYGEKFSVSELFSKSLALSPDLPAEALDAKSVGKLKQLTGNDVVSAAVKYKKNVQFKTTAKIVLATNHPLLLKVRD